MQAAANGEAEISEVLSIPAMRFGALDGFETSVVSYTTDIPAFDGAWGEPFLIGPGSIHFAHTAEERVPESELLEAIEIYQRMAQGTVTTMTQRIPVGILGATGMVGQEFVSFFAEPSVVRSDLAGRERPVGRQAVPRSHRRGDWAA